ncbi:MAG: polyphosphate kinase 2 family protein [Propionibacteriaceae bacterium]|nr:polyphosphate kinase 2 family protein [Propionibacteriaceae bacterium]
MNLRTALRPPANVDIRDCDPRATPLFPGKGEDDAARLTEKMAPKLDTLQERLYAENKENPTRNVLVILQGIDTAGKGGIIRHVFGLVDPQGVKIHAFKQPTEEELAHDFLWRIERALPGRGMIGIFDRSQYEDVLVVRVDEIVPPQVWEPRFDAINEWEEGLVASGTTIIKCFLHIDPATQQERLLARLENPSKHWKYSPGDVKVRRKWYKYMEAYQDVLNRCNTDTAPWYVIPSNHKWYRNWAVATLLLETLQDMDPQWPVGGFDVAEQIEAVKTSLPAES